MKYILNHVITGKKEHDMRLFEQDMRALVEEANRAQAYQAATFFILVKIAFILMSLLADKDVYGEKRGSIQ